MSGERSGAGRSGGSASAAGSAGGAAGSAAELDGATFEELMAELEQITAKLAAGDLGIEAAADLYERAERLHALATERLRQVRARVEGLTRPGVDPVAGPPASPAGNGPPDA